MDTEAKRAGKKVKKEKKKIVPNKKLSFGQAYKYSALRNNLCTQSTIFEEEGKHSGFSSPRSENNKHLSSASRNSVSNSDSRSSKSKSKRKRHFKVDFFTAEKTEKNEKN